MGFIPYYVNEGAFTAGTGALSVPVPAGYTDNDVFIMLVSTANQAITTPGGWTEVANSPQYTGDAGSAGGIRLGVFWKYVSGSQSAVSVADSGSYTAAQIFCYRRCNQTNPIHVSAGSVQASASTSWTAPEVITTNPNCLILICVGQDRDANSTDSITSWVNVNLANLVEVGDEVVNSGAGGGIGLAQGGKASPGATGTTAITSAASTTAAFLTIALDPTPPVTLSDGVTESKAVSEAVAGNIPASDDRSDSLGVAESLNGVITQGGVQAESIAAVDSPDGRIPYMPLVEHVETATIDDTVRTSTPPSQAGAAYLSDFDGPVSSVSVSVTVPTGTTLVVGVMLVFDYSYMGPIYSIPMPSMGGEPFVQEGILNEWGQTCFIVQHDPLIGSQTFTWNSGDSDEKVDHICLMFYTGTGENPIVSTLHSSGTISADPAILTGYAYDPIGLTVGVAVLSYDTQLTGETYTDDFQTLIGSFSPNGIDAGMVVFDKTINTHRVYTTNATRNAMSLMAINLQGRLDGGDVVIAAQDESSAPAAISDGEAPNAHQSETVDILALEGPYATINSAAPIVITPETQVNFGYTIDIPAGTEVIVLFCTAFTPSDFIDTFFYLNGESFTSRIVTDYYTTDLAGVAAYVFVNPPPGEHAFSWDYSGVIGYSMFVLNFLKNIDIITDPVVSVAHNEFSDFPPPGGTNWEAYVPPNGLAHNPGDIMIGMICSDTEFADTAEYPPMAGYPPPPSTLIQYAKVTRSHSEGDDWGGWHGLVGISMGPETTFGFTRQAGQQRTVAVALCLRCKNAPEWIDTLLNDVSVPETAAVADYPQIYELYDADVEISLLPVVIDGSPVDIPGGIVNEARVGCRAYLIRNNPSSIGITIEPEVNLFVAIFSSHWSDADTWIGLGDYTLTLNGVAATHYTMLDAGGRAITVAYVKNPTSGTLVIGIDNPHYNNEVDERDSDLFVAFQVKHADISGDPIRNLSGTTAGHLNNITISDIDYVLGDMVVGVLSADYYVTPMEIGAYPRLAWAGDYYYDPTPPINDWYHSLGIGCTRIGGDSSIFLNNINQANLYGFALVIKCGGDLIGATLNDTGTATTAPSSTAIGSLAFFGGGEDSLAADTDSPASLAFPVTVIDSGAIAEEISQTGGTAGAEVETVAIAVTVDTSIPVATSASDGMVIETTENGERIANSMGYAWAIVRAMQSASKTAEDSLADTLAPMEVIAAWRGLYASLADTVTVEEIVSSYTAAAGVIAESLAVDDDATAMMVSWGFAVETSFAVDAPTNTAIMNAGRVELFTVLDGYSAIRVECYFPEMSVTYGKAEYRAALITPLVAADLNMEEIVATFQQDNEVEAVFIQEEITAVSSTHEIEAVAAGAVVATLSPSTYIATKGE